MSTDNPFGAPVAGADDDFNIDMGEDSGFRIKKGKYPARVVGLDKGTSQAGNPMWIWTFAIIAGEYAGKEFKTWTALTAAAMWKLREVLMALKLSQDGKTSKFKKSDAIGKNITLDIEDDEYNGRPSSTVKTVLPFDEKLLKDMGGEKAAAKADVPF